MQPINMIMIYYCSNNFQESLLEKEKSFNNRRVQLSLEDDSGRSNFDENRRIQPSENSFVTSPRPTTKKWQYPLKKKPGDISGSLTRYKLFNNFFLLMKPCIENILYIFF